MKEINLEEILIQYSNICIDDRENVINAMKEACRQTLELAAENAKLYNDNDDCHYVDEDGNFPEFYLLDKQSILDTINQIN